MSEPLKPDPSTMLQQIAADIKAAKADAKRLEETYVKYILLANAGGILACLGIADALVGGKGNAAALSTLKGPMWLFLWGLVASGVIVSLQQARAAHEEETKAREAARILQENGVEVPPIKSGLPAFTATGLLYVTHAINVLGIIAQGCFLVGAIWGVAKIGG